MNSPWHLGIPDDEFFQRKPERGLLTKSEIRVVALSKLRLQPDSVFWDIGGGSGSVTIEGALLASKGATYVIEKDAEDCDNIRLNIQKFGTSNVTLVHGNAPEGIDAWADPDAIFIGGSGGRLTDILSLSAQRLRPNGRIVVDAATIETMTEANNELKAHNMSTEITMVSISRSKDIVGLTRFEALNPVFIITGWHK